MPRLTHAHLKQILVDALQLSDPDFRLETSERRISGAIISDSFRGKGDHERLKMIWDALDKTLGAEAVRMVGMLLPYTREEWESGLDALAIMKARVKAKTAKIFETKKSSIRHSKRVSGSSRKTPAHAP